MGKPRFSIATLMALVAIASLNLLAIRAAVPGTASESFQLLCLGVTPMASLLAFLRVANIRSADQASRLLPTGFEVFGWGAVVLFAITALAKPGLIGTALESLNPIFDPIFNAMGQDSPILVPFIFLVVISALTAPQLALALAGGWLFRGCTVRLVIERRETGPRAEIAPGGSP
jgi:hypothetical protein